MVGSAIRFFWWCIYCAICYWRTSICLLPWPKNQQPKGTSRNYGLCYLYADILASHLDGDHWAYIELASDWPGYLFNAGGILGALDWNTYSYQVE